MLGFFRGRLCVAIARESERREKSFGVCMDRVTLFAFWCECICINVMCALRYYLMNRVVWRVWFSWCFDFSTKKECFRVFGKLLWAWKWFVVWTLWWILFKEWLFRTSKGMSDIKIITCFYIKIGWWWCKTVKNFSLIISFDLLIKSCNIFSTIISIFFFFFTKSTW